MSTIRPKPGKILIKDAEAEKVGVFTVATDEKNREGITGVVVAVGESESRYASDGSLYLVECPVKVGDTVIYTKYHFSDVYSGGEHFKIVKFEDILADIDGL